MAAKDDLKVKVAELSTEMRFVAKSVSDHGQVLKELADSVKKLAEGMQHDLTALKIWQAEITQKEKTNISWWLKVEYYIIAIAGGVIGYIGKAFGLVAVVK